METGDTISDVLNVSELSSYCICVLQLCDWSLNHLD